MSMSTGGNYRSRLWSRRLEDGSIPFRYVSFLFCDGHYLTWMMITQGQPGILDNTGQFVSAVCWQRTSPGTMVAANSQGKVTVMEMV